MPENSVTSYPYKVPSAVGLVGSLIWCLPLTLLAAVTPSCETLPLGRAQWAVSSEKCVLTSHQALWYLLFFNCLHPSWGHSTMKDPLPPLLRWGLLSLPGYSACKWGFEPIKQRTEWQARYIGLESPGPALHPECPSFLNHER